MDNLTKIKNRIKDQAKKCNRESSVELLAVTKNRSIDEIQKLINQGQRLFGENRIQEAYAKWPLLKQQYKDIELHLIGHLQTNKVKDAIALFDVIQTLDSVKLAEKLFHEEQKQNKKLIYFIEINIGHESQKTGILPNEFHDFFEKIKNNFPLNIKGIMCIPPNEKDPEPFFKEMRSIANSHDISVISMGMSQDYESAIKFGATMVRIGTALFSED